MDLLAYSIIIGIYVLTEVALVRAIKGRVITLLPHWRTFCEEGKGAYTASEYLGLLERRFHSLAPYRTWNRLGVVAPLLGLLLTIFSIAVTDMAVTDASRIGDFRGMFCGVAVGAICALIHHILFVVKVGAIRARLLSLAETQLQDVIGKAIGQVHRDFTRSLERSIHGFAEGIAGIVTRVEPQVGQLAEHVERVGCAVASVAQRCDEGGKSLELVTENLRRGVLDAATTLSAQLNASVSATHNATTAFAKSLDSTVAPIEAAAVALRGNTTALDSAMRSVGAASKSLEEASVAHVAALRDTDRRSVEILDRTAGVIRQMSEKLLPALEGVAIQSQEASRQHVEAVRRVADLADQLDERFQRAAVSIGHFDIVLGQVENRRLPRSVPPASSGLISRIFRLKRS